MLTISLRHRTLEPRSAEVFRREAEERVSTDWAKFTDAYKRKKLQAK